MRAMRSTPPMRAGARSTTRSTAPTPFRATRMRRRGKGYNPARGKQVIAWARRFLDEAVPLASGSHADARGYTIKNGALSVGAC